MKEGLLGTLKVQFVSTFSTLGSFPVQEDRIWFDQERGIFIVADGFGGPIAGVAAAQQACEAVERFLIKEAGDREATLPFVMRRYFSLSGNILFNAMLYANQNLHVWNQGKQSQEKGGASLLAGLMDGSLLALAHVGVCEAWLLRDRQSASLVTPRSFERLCHPLGHHEHPWQRIPLIALGMTEDVEPEIFEYRLQPKDWLILATDGMQVSQKTACTALDSSQEAFEESLLQQVIGLKQQNESSELLEHRLEQLKTILDQRSYRDNASWMVIGF